MTRTGRRWPCGRRGAAGSRDAATARGRSGCLAAGMRPGEGPSTAREPGPAAGPVPDLRPPALGAGEALSLPATQFVTLALGQPRKHAGSFRPSRLEHEMLFLPGAQFVDA